jgi:hypothetical protein
LPGIGDDGRQPLGQQGADEQLLIRAPKRMNGYRNQVQISAEPSETKAS